MLLCMYPFRFSVKLLHYILKNISDYSSRRTPAAKSTASTASITFLLKFFQFPSCFRCQICRNFNLYSCIFITVYRRIIHCNDTFASQTYLRSGLSTRFNVTENITVNSVNLRLTAKYCCCKWMPLRWAFYCGVFCGLCSLMVLGHVFYVKYVIDDAVPGWATMTASVLFLGGIQLVGIGILGEYIGRVFEEVKQRPLYLVGRHLGKK